MLISLEELSQNIKNLQNDEAEGIDYIRNEYIKSCPIEVIQLAVILFNLILKTGIVPTEWSVGLIIPIFKKKGSPHDPNNYRGITLLSCLCKLFTLCINVRLNLYVTRRGIIGEEQSAFRESLIKPYYFIRPSAMKMCTLFNSSPKQLSNLAKFTEHIMTKF